MMPIELKSWALQVLCKRDFFKFSLAFLTVQQLLLPVSYHIYQGIKAETAINLISPQYSSASKGGTRRGRVESAPKPSVFAYQTKVCVAWLPVQQPAKKSFIYTL